MRPLVRPLERRADRRDRGHDLRDSSTSLAWRFSSARTRRPVRCASDSNSRNRPVGSTRSATASSCWYRSSVTMGRFAFSSRGGSVPRAARAGRARPPGGGARAAGPGAAGRARRVARTSPRRCGPRTEGPRADVRARAPAARRASGRRARAICGRGACLSGRRTYAPGFPTGVRPRKTRAAARCGTPAARPRPGDASPDS